ncbi:MAG: ClpXP protease specificity-enhancing factor [Gammaproteobacteria bacterium]|nr:ClpXP protease specificity-enhancing factor [Gammaproteobacteria bacterium]
MTSNKPYLIRALYEWLVDNDATPYILVNSQFPGVEIPAGIDKEGQVVLNIAARAVQGLEMSNEYITFSARFNGISQQLFIPVQSVMAIYSMEDGQGMMFADDAQAEAGNESVEKEDAKKEPEPSKKPGLTIVK